MPTKKKLSEMSQEEIDKLSEKEYNKLKAEEEEEEAEIEKAAEKIAKKKRIFTMRRGHLYFPKPEEGKDKKGQFTPGLVTREEFHKKETHYVAFVEALYGDKEAALDSTEFIEVSQAEFAKLEAVK